MRLSGSGNSDSLKFAFLGLYGVAMGMFEAVLVIYLRMLYYPGGFEFPLNWISSPALPFELLRELSTLVMIAAVAVVAAGDRLKRLAWFLYIFAVWDIFYYIFLKLLIGWPESLLTRDILFLIPVTWVGPVLAPVICSVTMILMACCILLPGFYGFRTRTGAVDWLLIYGGAFLVFLSFIEDYAMLIIRGGFLPRFFELHRSSEFISRVTEYVPESFNWPLFAAGEALILAGLYMIARRTYKTREIIRQGS
ncbi:MAG: hypothetical protein R6U43_05795 [Candidatus Krumholzibacteriales bacterium]